MFCNGACCFCSVPCTKEISRKSDIEEHIKEEHIGTYEIKKTLFGKDKVRKVKNESRSIGIEYTPQ